MSTFQNLLISKKAELTGNNIDLLNQLSELPTTSEILNKWYFTNLLPKGKNCKDWNVIFLRDYLAKRMKIEQSKKLADFENRLQTVFNATNQITEITISVDWVKNRTWGLCPQAVARVCYADNTVQTFTSSRVTGSGYDKLSTCVAQSLNQCNDLLNMLYTIKDQNPTEKNHSLLGYGSGYGLLPSFEGGVGVECYNAIFEKIGYKFSSVTHGKTFDVYSVTRL